MSRVARWLWAPAVSGIILLIVVWLDVSFFNVEPEDIQASLAREQVIILVGFLSSFIVLVVSLRWLYLKQWRNVFYSWFSVILYFVCFLLGAIYGGALTHPA